MKIEHMGVGWAELEGTGGRWEAFLSKHVCLYPSLPPLKRFEGLHLSSLRAENLEFCESWQMSPKYVIDILAFSFLKFCFPRVCPGKKGS